MKPLLIACALLATSCGVTLDAARMAVKERCAEADTQVSEREPFDPKDDDALDELRLGCDGALVGLKRLGKVIHELAKERD